MLGNIIDDVMPPQEEPEAQTETETETQVAEENEDGLGEEGCGVNYVRRVFEFKELVSLRNRSCGRLDWRYWTHGSR
ncbi:hypothetical protein HanIR_Chr08g0389161 [Helianthus annuus]|nr:hypothetical protein HanIR_Chr08g0389161 [Helianthus annuus]